MKAKLDWPVPGYFFFKRQIPQCRLGGVCGCVAGLFLGMAGVEWSSITTDSPVDPERHLDQSHCVHRGTQLTGRIQIGQRAFWSVQATRHDSTGPYQRVLEAKV